MCRTKLNVSLPIMIFREPSTVIIFLLLGQATSVYQTLKVLIIWSMVSMFII